MRFVVPSVDLRRYRPAHTATKLLTQQYCEEHVIVPVSIARGVLIVAVVDPEAQAALTEEVTLITGMQVEVVRASIEEIEDTIAACYGAVN